MQLRNHCIQLLTTLMAVGGLLACSSVDINDYADNRPKLIIEEFFSGQLRAHGIVKNRGGQVIRYFNADIQASHDGETITLEENFEYDDGSRQTRTWTLRHQGNGRYLGTANDVVGETVLDPVGNALFMNYVLELPYKGKTREVKVDDRMYLVAPDVIVNESTIRKFGIRFGSVTLVIEKR